MPSVPYCAAAKRGSASGSVWPLPQGTRQLRPEAAPQALSSPAGTDTRSPRPSCFPAAEIMQGQLRGAGAQGRVTARVPHGPSEDGRGRQVWCPSEEATAAIAVRIKLREADGEPSFLRNPAAPLPCSALPSISEAAGQAQCKPWALL